MLGSASKIKRLGDCRLFSSFVGRIPNFVTQELEQKFAQIDFNNAVVNRNPKSIASGATIMVQKLKNAAENEGNGDAASLLTGLSGLKNKKYEAVYLQGTSTNRKVLEYTTSIFASLINPNLVFSENITLDGSEFDLMPHSDAAQFGSDFKLNLTMLAGIKSKGKVQTYKMDINELYQELSEQTREILAQPIFGYLATKPKFFGLEERSLLKSKILYHDQDGRLNVSFDYGLRRSLEFNSQATNFSASQIKLGLDEIHNKVDDFYKNNRFEPFVIEQGGMLILLNRLTTHGVKVGNQAGISKSEVDPQRHIEYFSFLLPNGAEIQTSPSPSALLDTKISKLNTSKVATTDNLSRT